MDVQVDTKGNWVISGLTQKLVQEEFKVFEWLAQGERIRKIATTDFNEASSRSHTIFKINLEMVTKNSFTTHVSWAEVNLVDLAGSEGVSMDQDQERAIERSNINKSLLALKMIIKSKAEQNQNKHSGPSYISYRQSKLTRILKNSFSGNSKTWLIWTLNQNEKNKIESLQTLRFGCQAKKIKMKIVHNRGKDKTSVDMEDVKRIEEENKMLRQQNEELYEKLEMNKLENERFSYMPQTDEEVNGNTFVREWLNYTQSKLQQQALQCK